jgi:hypothetical protein
LRVFTQPGETQFTMWVEAKPWTRRTGSPPPCGFWSMKARSKPSCVKNCIAPAIPLRIEIISTVPDSDQAEPESKTGAQATKQVGFREPERSVLFGYASTGSTENRHLQTSLT